MNEIFLVVWLSISVCSPMYGIEKNKTCNDNPSIQSQTVSTKSELNKLYQEHKDDGVRVWKIAEPFSLKTGLEVVELEFVSEPCGSWKEKK